MIYTEGLSSLWNKWNILCTVVKLIWDAIVEDYQLLLYVPLTHASLYEATIISLLPRTATATRCGNVNLPRRRRTRRRRNRYTKIFSCVDKHSSLHFSWVMSFKVLLSSACCSHVWKITYFLVCFYDQDSDIL